MHKIVLVVDIRERALYDGILRLLSLQKTPSKNLESVEVHFKSLELGDIKVVLYDNDTVVRELSMERKTLSDLVSSIRDGRYREQKARLLDNVRSQDISYIIEGDTVGDSLCRNDKVVSSAYCNMVFRDNIHVFFTRDVSETAVFLVSLSAKMLGKPGNYVSTATGDTGTGNVAKDYTSLLKLKSKKNHNITPDNCFILQLAQIPSVSNVIAKNIVKVFANFGLLLDTMRTCCSQDEKIKVLSRIDKVGKAKASKIVEYMHL